MLKTEDVTIQVIRGHPGLNQGPPTRCRMPYHWAISPSVIKQEKKVLLFIEQRKYIVCIFMLCSKLKLKRLKKPGDTRDWTWDLSICSRMLYHWAISPSVTVQRETVVLCIERRPYQVGRSMPCSKLKLKQSKKAGDNRDWTRDRSICSRMLYHWAISPSVTEQEEQILLFMEQRKYIVCTSMPCSKLKM